MGFTEVIFLFVFLPATILLYVLVNGIFHSTVLNNTVLAGLSIFFYYWADKSTLVVFLLIVAFTYVAGNIDRSAGKKKLLFPIAFLVGILVVYKYWLFLSSWINQISRINIIQIKNLIVPIGISFVVFEAISYVVDIYRGDAEAGNFLECLTFLSFFPKLVSGPIVLWKDFSPQLKERKITASKVTEGIDRIIIGYAKKVIIADTFGAQIRLISGRQMDVPSMWIMALLYFFQLYIDFSGYSDIAIGLSSIFGFELKENFSYPYRSASITEFWRRWHISLGTWFREYVYIPLGGNRKGNVYLHLFIVFLLTGIWHGFSLPYLAWGCVNGSFVVIERAVRNKAWYRRIPKSIKWIFTICIVYFSWILFMSSDVAAAGANYRALFVSSSVAPLNFTWRYYLSKRIVLFLIIACVGSFSDIGNFENKAGTLLQTPAWSVIKRMGLLLLFLVDILFVVNSTYSPFLYFQF